MMMVMMTMIMMMMMIDNMREYRDKFFGRIWMSSSFLYESIFTQTIAPGGFCTIGGKPKPCKFLSKIKQKAQQQVDRLGSWLQENNPSVESLD